MRASRSSYKLQTGRPVTFATRQMVSTPHYLASTAGNAILEQGGSAVDAIIAANAVLTVVYNHMSGLGGDLFAQVWDPKTGKVDALNASGRAGAEANLDFYRTKGHTQIEARGPLAAITVPGAVDGWWQLHQRYGKLPWQALFQHAIDHANGFPLSARFADFIARYRSTLELYESTANLYLPGGHPIQPGRVLSQPDLARSLTLIAEKGVDVFYRGELAEKLVRGLREVGGILNMDDFAGHISDWVEPIRTEYRGYEITELPPNTQGIAALMILNILEKYDMAGIGEGTADYYHLMTEAVKLAFVDRDRWVTDPTHLDIPVDQLLSKDYGRKQAERIDMQFARPEEEIEIAQTGGDTVYLCAVDGEGQVVSLIQSPYYEFGSAFVVPGTGILMQNRGSFFSLDPQHINVLAPGKRTFHTIIPALALRDGKPVLAFGTMGGEGQPQTQAALLTRMVDYGMNVQEAIEAPRWLYGRTWGQESRTLKLEGRIPDGIVDDLVRRGHAVEMMQNWSQTMGHAQAIWIDREQGVLHGGADPRGDGLAIGR